MKNYFWRIAISLDQLLNTILNGNEDETLSSRMGKHLAKHEKCPVCSFLCRMLNYIQKDHCVRAIEPDRGEKL